LWLFRPFVPAARVSQKKSKGKTGTAAKRGATLRQQQVRDIALPSSPLRLAALSVRELCFLIDGSDQGGWGGCFLAEAKAQKE
jgi:hypothetical protein